MCLNPRRSSTPSAFGVPIRFRLRAVENPHLVRQAGREGGVLARASLSGEAVSSGLGPQMESVSVQRYSGLYDRRYTDSVTDRTG